MTDHLGPTFPEFMRWWNAFTEGQDDSAQREIAWRAWCQAIQFQRHALGSGWVSVESLPEGAVCVGVDEKVTHIFRLPHGRGMAFQIPPV